MRREHAWHIITHMYIHILKVIYTYCVACAEPGTRRARALSAPASRAYYTICNITRGIHLLRRRVHSYAPAAPSRRWWTTPSPQRTRRWGPCRLTHSKARAPFSARPRAGAQRFLFSTRRTARCTAQSSTPRASSSSPPTGGLMHRSLGVSCVL